MNDNHGNAIGSVSKLVHSGESCVQEIDNKKRLYRYMKQSFYKAPVNGQRVLTPEHHRHRRQYRCSNPVTLLHIYITKVQVNSLVTEAIGKMVF